MALAIGLIGVSLAACSSAGTQRVMVGAVPDDYRVNHPITISETLATMDVPVGRETPYLARGMDENILAFAASFLNARSPEIAIVLPSGAANTHNASSIALQIESIFLGAGIPSSAISFRAYPAHPGEAQAPIRLAYVRISAETAPCGPWPDDLSDDNDNRNYANFGCATQQNLAAMVSNPLDLLYPRVMTPPSAARRTGVLGAYESGADTGTAYDDFPFALGEL
ncbi:MAG: CpaD family pilus assembly protein [Bauldia sp.]|nr:CpaD family pilus assembly protein [Bauldia sp.]